MSTALVIAHADVIDQIRDTDAAAVWSIRLDDCDQSERQRLIDHHGRVAAVLRKRGHRIRAGMVHADEGEFITLRLATRGVQTIEGLHGLA